MADPLSKAAGQILALLPKNGKPVGSIFLRRELDIPPQKFREAKYELVEKGYAKPGKGRGGSLCRADSAILALNTLAQAIESLVVPQSPAGRAFLRTRKDQNSDPDIDLENQAWQLVYHLGPKLITSERDPVINLRSKFQPDIVAVFSNFVLICECKNTTHGTYISDWLDKVEYFRDQLSSLAKEAGLPRVIYICVVKDDGSIDEKVRARVTKNKVKLVTASRVSYFLNIQREVGIGIRHLFWGTTVPSVVNLEEESVPALSVRLGRKREAFVFSINAHRLLPRAVVSHRELNDPKRGVKGYQRMLKRSRLGAIKKHIEKFGTFPTPIVVALDRNTRFDPSKGGEGNGRSRLGQLWLPGKPGSVQVIDGQHRLLGYSLVDEEEDHIVHVIGYRQNEDLDPAAMFVDINAKQKPVASGLLWELYPDIYGEEHPEYHKSLISQAVETAVAAIKEKVTHISSRTRGPITFQSLCSEVQKSGLMTKTGGLVCVEAGDHGRQVRKLEQWLDAFFSALVGLQGDHPTVVENLLLRNVGMVPALRLFGRILRYEQGIGNHQIVKDPATMKQQVTQYIRVICDHYAQRPISELESIRSQRSSQGGFKRMFEEFLDIIDARYRPGFAGRKASARLTTATDEVIAIMTEINLKGVRLGATAAWTFKDFEGAELRRLAKKKELDVDSFEKFVVKLHQELVEGSGENGPNNRLAKLLGITEILSISILRQLTSLRVYFSHKGSQIEAPKRKAAVETLQSLLGSPAPPDPKDLSSEECNQAICNLLSTIKAEVLSPAIAKLTTS